MAFSENMQIYIITWDRNEVNLNIISKLLLETSVCKKYLFTLTEELDFLLELTWL